MAMQVCVLSAQVQFANGTAPESGGQVTLSVAGVAGHPAGLLALAVYTMVKLPSAGMHMPASAPPLLLPLLEPLLLPLLEPLLPPLLEPVSDTEPSSLPESPPLLLLELEDELHAVVAMEAAHDPAATRATTVR
jgi:hypothetical protein